MARLQLFIALSILSIACGYLIDRTDDHLGSTVHTIPEVTRTGTHDNIRIHYELVDLNLDTSSLEYLTNTVIDGAKRYLQNALTTDSVDQTLFFGCDECAGVDVPDRLRF
jgi:hypothetical protein